MAELLKQLTGNADDLVDGLNHVYRDADGARLIRDRAGDGLTDPPGRVGRELEALGAVELFDRLDQAEVALLNEVEEQHAAADIALCNGNDQTEVGLRQTLFRAVARLDVLVELCALLGRDGVALCRDAFGSGAALLHALRERYLLLGREQVDLADLLEVHTDRVVDGEGLRHGRGVDQLLLGNLLDRVRLEAVVVAVAERLFQNAFGLDLDAHRLQCLVQLVDVIALQLEMAERVRHFLERQTAVFLAEGEQVAQDLLLLRRLFSALLCLVVRHIVCPPAFWFFMRPNVSSGSSPACVSVPSLTRCNRIVFMYSRSSAR